MKNTKVSFSFYLPKREVYEDNKLENIEYWVPVSSLPKDAYASQFAALIPKLAFSEKFPSNEEANSTQRKLEIIIAFVDNESLSDPAVIEELYTKSGLREITDPISRRFAEEYSPKPMICIGLDNLMELDASEGNPQSELKKKLVNKIHQRVDPRFRVLDSSIWNRYVSLSSPHSFGSRLSKTIDEICLYYENGLYDAVIAQEYLEFQCRKLQQSYLKNYPGGHAKLVTPFRFHSESKMRQMAIEKRRELLQSGSRTWSCLLADDYAQKPLRTTHKQKSTNKLDWLNFLFNDTGETKVVRFLNPEKSWNRNPQFNKSGRKFNGYVSYFFNLLTSSKELDNHRPDIIILDYFFGIEERHPDERYGHKLIKNLKKYHRGLSHSKDVSSIAPSNSSLAFGKYWIFPISAFEHAFQSHLRLMGDSAINDLIEIADGADPINSPELFRYLFYCFMQYQEYRVGYKSKVIRQQLYSDEILKQKDQLPLAMAKVYPRIVDVNAKLRLLSQEKEDSDLAKSFFDQHERRVSLLEFGLHVQKLLGLVAFGSNLEWPKMWQEYLLLISFKNKVSEEFFEDLIPPEILKLIVDHIANLQEKIGR
ncbi:MAG: hypothetical protein AB8H47_27845 [Bacteroidia bacterium]